MVKADSKLIFFLTGADILADNNQGLSALSYA
jgi:hypothetical protein